VRDILQAQASGAEIVEPGLLGEVIGSRIALVLARAGVDQNRVPGRAHEERLVGDHHAAAHGIEHDGVEFSQAPAPYLGIIGREHDLGRAPRTVALNEAGDGDLADFERFHAGLPALLPLSYGRGLG
jgi:hypothetical protein